MKITIISDNIKNSEGEYSFLKTNLPFTMVNIIDPQIEGLPCRNSFDLLLIDTHKSISEIIVGLKREGLGDRCFIRLNGSDLLSPRELIELGIEDFYSSPVNGIELSAKIMRYMDHELKPIFKNSKLGLSLKQQMIIEVLRSCRTTGATRRGLLEKVWPNESVDPKSVDVHIYNIRKIIKERGQSINWNKDRWFLVN